MVLIISNEKDYSTNNVIKHLIAGNIEFIRLTEKRFVSGLNIEIPSGEITLNINLTNKTLKLSEIHSFWYRKHTIDLFKEFTLKFPEKINNNLKEKIYSFLFNDELKSIFQFLVHQLSLKKHIGSFSIGEANKLICFQTAKEVGLNVPNLIVSTKTSELLSFYEKMNDVILKPIEDGFGALFDNIAYKIDYKILSKKEFLNKDKNVFPSCLQEYIEKKLEIRVFYLKRKCYSMAIFSQENKKTQVDFRNYDGNLPNRMVPYYLPKEIQNKITMLMTKLDLNTGSLDLILNKKNKYVFLEINPGGQYGMISESCNYPLDYIIFKELTK